MEIPGRQAVDRQADQEEEARGWMVEAGIKKPPPSRGAQAEAPVAERTGNARRTVLQPALAGPTTNCCPGLMASLGPSLFSFINCSAVIPYLRLIP